MQQLVARKTASVSPLPQLQLDLQPELPLEEEDVFFSHAPYGLDHVLQHIGCFVEMDPFTFVIEGECLFVQLKSNAYLRFERRYLHERHANIFNVGLFRPLWNISWDGVTRMGIYHERLSCAVSRKDGGIVHDFLKKRIVI